MSHLEEEKYRTLFIANIFYEISSEGGVWLVGGTITLLSHVLSDWEATR